MSGGENVGVKLGALAAAPLVYVRPDEPLTLAVSLMRREDFSQLPVVEDDGAPCGAITWRSVGKGLMGRHVPQPSAPVGDFLEPARVVPTDEDLVDVLGDIYAQDFVIVSVRGKAFGIVTTADVVRLYGEKATPLFWIEELERRLRTVLDQVISGDDIAAHAGKPKAHKTSVDDLTLGEGQRIIADPEVWARLNWNWLDHDIFIERLEEIRHLRNRLAHFRPGPVEDDEMSRLRHFVRLLREQQKLHPDGSLEG